MVTLANVCLDADRLLVGICCRYIPSDLGYGDRGAGGDIGPGDTLVFTMEIIEINGRHFMCDTTSQVVFLNYAVKRMISERMISVANEHDCHACSYKYLSHIERPHCRPNTGALWRDSILSIDVTL